MDRFCRYVRWRLFLLAPLISLSACTHPAQIPPPQMDVPREESPAPAAGTKVGIEALGRATGEGELLRAAIAVMGDASSTGQYQTGRAALEEFLRLYPNSFWKPFCLSVIRLIDEQQDGIRKLRQDQQLMDKNGRERARLLQENSNLKKEIRQLHERLQEEAVRVRQENDQLKRDLMLLKDLEIQREKREKSLR